MVCEIYMYLAVGLNRDKVDAEWNGSSHMQQWYRSAALDRK